jgi:hypothetical protein
MQRWLQRWPFSACRYDKRRGSAVLTNGELNSAPDPASLLSKRNLVLLRFGADGTNASHLGLAASLRISWTTASHGCHSGCWRFRSCTPCLSRKPSLAAQLIRLAGGFQRRMFGGDNLRAFSRRVASLRAFPQLCLGCRRRPPDRRRECALSPDSQAGSEVEKERQ